MYEKIVAWDTETTGFARFEGDLVFSYSFTDIYTGETRVFRLPVLEYGPWLEQVVAAGWHPQETPWFKNVYSRHDNYLRLQDFFADTSIVKTAHNHKFDLGFARAMGINVPAETIIHCTMLMSQALMNLAPSHALDEQAYYIYKYPVEQDNEVAKRVKMLQAKQKRGDTKAKHSRRIYTSCYERVPVDIMTRYQIADGERAALLYKALSKKLYGMPAQWTDYLGDVNLIIPTIRQEEFGIRLDDRKNNNLIKEIEEKLLVAERETTESVIKQFPKDFPNGINTKSPKQLRHLIADCMGYELTKTTKKGTNVSTDGTVLAELFDQTGDTIFDNMMRCTAFKTGLANLHSYTALAHPADRRIHATHNPNQARTGRQSVSNPNLQNIAKAKSKSRYPIPARRCFAADPGCVLWMPDYSGIELRIIADIAGEEEYLQAIAGTHPEGYKDCHVLTSHVMYDDHWDLVEEMLRSPAGLPVPQWMHDAFTAMGHESVADLRKLMRDGVKNFAFGTAYGGRLEKTGVALATLTWDEKVAAAERFAKRFPKIANFTPNVQREMSSRGYIVTAFGRKLFLQRSAIHKSANYTVQGTAAGPLKRAEVRVDGYARENCGDLLHEVVTVHDEMVLSVNRKLLPYANYIAADIAKLMEVHRELKVQMEVEFKQTSTNWAAAKELKFKVPEDWEFGRFNINEPGYGYNF